MIKREKGEGWELFAGFFSRSLERKGRKAGSLALRLAAVFSLLGQNRNVRGGVGFCKKKEGMKIEESRREAFRGRRKGGKKRKEGKN